MRLDKESVVKLYCYCREAERSVHRALSDPWPDFLAYYGADKTDPIRQLIQGLAGAARKAGPCPDPPPNVGVLDMSVWRMFVRFCFGRWLVRWETGWSFPEREICYILGRLEALFRLLASPTRPEPQVLIALRMAFCECEHIIAQRCYGLRGIEIAQGIDHFNKTAWLPQVTLADVLKKSA
jgi:hypothetical protein